MANEQQNVLVPVPNDDPAPAPTPSTGSSISMMVQANVVLLGTSLVAAFSKTDAGTQILITPTDAKAGTLSIAEMIQQVNSLIQNVTGETDQLKSEDVENQLSGLVDAGSQGGSILDDIKVSLKQAFLYINRPTGASEQSVLEYALDVEVYCNIMQEFTLLNIKSFSLALWNTSRQSVLDRMDLKSLQELLNEYSA